MLGFAKRYFPCFSFGDRNSIRSALYLSILAMDGIFVSRIVEFLFVLIFLCDLLLFY